MEYCGGPYERTQLTVQMIADCIHGFQPEHCSACRTCPHGNITSHCARCLDPVAGRADAKLTPAAEPSQKHRGHEIFFVPAERSWYYREGPDGEPSRESYRSAFTAKRGLDAALDNPPAPKGKKGH
jgi:hypothetical protein